MWFVGVPSVTINATRKYYREEVVVFFLSGHQTSYLADELVWKWSGKANEKPSKRQQWLVM